MRSSNCSATSSVCPASFAAANSAWAYTSPISSACSRVAAMCESVPAAAADAAADLLQRRLDQPPMFLVRERTPQQLAGHVRRHVRHPLVQLPDGGIAGDADLA